MSRIYDNVGKLTKVRKQVEHWIFPPGIKNLIYQTYKSYIARQVPDEVLSRCHDNAELRDAFAGERCFILATGRSINEQDLRPLADEVCIGMSMFYLHENIETIDPEFYVFAPNHQPHKFELPRKYITGLNDAIGGETQVFFGHRNYEYSFYRYLQQHPSAEPANYSYINYNGSQQLTKHNYDTPSLWDISSRPFSIRTTFLVALQVAVYLGFEEIYLLGTDYDYLKYADESRSKYFYDEKYKIQNEADMGWTTEDLFRTYYESWREFRWINEVLSTRDQQVYNATAGGELDVFPRVSLDSIL